MKIENMDHLIGTPDIGTTYLVRTIVGSIGGKLEAQRWPILVGPRHYDVEFFGIHAPHYHLDARFIRYERWLHELKKDIVVTVGRFADGSLPEIIHMEMKCLNEAFILHNVEANIPGGFDAMKRHFRGAQCAGSRRQGWICPHKQTWLGNQHINCDNVMVCPAHGLKIDAATGKVL